MLRFIVVAVAAACLLGFGLGLAGNGVATSEFSTNREALRSELGVASSIVVANVLFLSAAIALWSKSAGVRRLYFDIPPRAWIALATAAQFSGFICGWWVFAA